MGPKHGTSQQNSSLRPQSGFRDTYTANHRRSSSVTSQGHRHEPYKTASRQSSISSLSGAMPLSDGNSSEWQSQWESTDEARNIKNREAHSASPLSNAELSICPADLQVKPTALRAQRSVPSFTAQVLVPKTEQVDNAEESDAFSEMEMDHTYYSRKSRAKVPVPIIATEPFSQNGKAEGTARTSWSRSSGITRNSRKSNPQKSYRGDTEARDSPILVTAITSSGKKSHARKVSPIFPGRAKLTLPTPQRPQNHIPRPRNAFILFRKHVVDSKLIPPEVEIRHQNISVVVAKMWAEVRRTTIR